MLSDDLFTRPSETNFKFLIDESVAQIIYIYIGDEGRRIIRDQQHEFYIVVQRLLGPVSAFFQLKVSFLDLRHHGVETVRKVSQLVLAKFFRPMGIILFSPCNGVGCFEQMEDRV